MCCLVKQSLHVSSLQWHFVKGLIITPIGNSPWKPPVSRLIYRRRLNAPVLRQTKAWTSFSLRFSCLTRDAALDSAMPNSPYTSPYLNFMATDWGTRRYSLEFSLLPPPPPPFFFFFLWSALASFVVRHIKERLIYLLLAARSKRCSVFIGGTGSRRSHSSGAVWESRWPSWAVRPSFRAFCFPWT